MREWKLLPASKIDGCKVVNRQGKNLGTVKDVLIDRHSGRAAYVVVSYGSTLGIGGKLYPLPWDALAYDTKSEAYTLDMPEDKIKAAPGFDKEEEMEHLADPDRAKVIHEYYGSKADWYRAAAPIAAERSATTTVEPVHEKERIV